MLCTLKCSNLTTKTYLPSFIIVVFNSCVVHTNCLNLNNNKKVLLRERKRHTDRGVSSTPSVTRGGVVPLPPARSEGGTQDGVLPRPGLPGGGGTQGGVPPWTWPGYPLSDLAGVPPRLDLAGVPPPPPGVDRQTDTCQNITFPSYYVHGR